MPGSFLSGVRVLELADEPGEFCGRLLAGAGADVIKIEPPGGSPTRPIGPFVDDVEDPERSLHFWHYCLGKRSVAIDITTPPGQVVLKRLVATADVVLESYPPGTLDGLGLGYEALGGINPRIVMASITPFGQEGPIPRLEGLRSRPPGHGWGDDEHRLRPDPRGRVRRGPGRATDVALQPCSRIQMVDAILAALLYRERTGQGQFLDGSVHRAVSLHTGSDLPMWIFGRQTVKRQTGRYGTQHLTPESLAQTKDGRNVLAFVSAEFRIGSRASRLDRDARRPRRCRRPHRPEIRRPRLCPAPRGDPPRARGGTALGRRLQVRP